MINRALLEPVLATAVKEKQYDVAESYLKQGAKGSSIDVNGNSPLHLAVLNDDPKMVALLLQYRVDLGCKDFNSFTPIALAALKRYWRCVFVMVKEKREDLSVANGKYQYGHALLYAVEKNRFFVASSLLNAGAGEWYNINHNYPLHLAVKNNNPWMIGLLKKYKGVDNLERSNTASQTPMQLAANLKYWNCSIALADANKYDPRSILLTMCILVAACSDKESHFYDLPFDVLKLILTQTYKQLDSDETIVSRMIIAAKIFADSRSDLKLFNSVTLFAKEHQSLALLRKVVKAQSGESAQFVKTLQDTVDLQQPTTVRAASVRNQIGLFVTQKGDRKSRAIELLGKHGLLPKNK